MVMQPSSDINNYLFTNFDKCNHKPTNTILVKFVVTATCKNTSHVTAQFLMFVNVKYGKQSDDDTRHYNSRINTHFFVEYYLSPNRAKEASRAKTQTIHSIPNDKICDLADITMPEHARLTATRTPPAAKPGYGGEKRGAEAAKNMERESVEYKLSPKHGITFPALSARPNYLSHDQADKTFSN